MRGVRLILGCASFALAVSSLFAQYDVLLGDRDLERGVLRFDPSTSTTTIFGGCTVSSGLRFYYGMDFDPATGYLWVCNTLQSRIDGLDANGNCVGSIPTEYLPTGLAVHPNGRYAYVTTSSNIIYCYDLQADALPYQVEVEDASGFYGLAFSSQAEFLYVCDFYGGKLYQFAVDNTQTPPALRLANSVQFSQRRGYTVNPYDVAVRTSYAGRSPIDYIYVTLTTGFYGPYSEVAAGQFAYDTPGFLPEPTTFAVHPNAGGPGNVSFFGIEIAPDGLLWVSQYLPGGLFTVNSSGTVTQRADYGSNKLGVGIAIFQPRCVSHRGDVDSNGCVDDADLLAVLFAFGQSGGNLGRVDINCDSVVDDADLLIVLFNFGAGC
jgi:hypothetical protein